MITISHNVTQPLADIDELNKIINNSKFQLVLNNCHLHNKKILFDLLRPEISNLINLKITTNG